MKPAEFRHLDRRSLMKKMATLGGLATIGSLVPAHAMSGSSPMQKILDKYLFAEHPRLHLRKSQWAALRQSIEQDELLNRWHKDLRTLAQKMLTESPAEYKLKGPRLLNQSRNALRRISTLAALYRLDGEKAMADHARTELHAICSFPSWHPPHFLDVAEMTNAAGLGYDWLYDVLSEEERQLIRTKIIEFGLRPGLAEYKRGVVWSMPGANNWGQVCAGGLTIGALAIANDDVPGSIAPEPAAILNWTTDKVRNAMASYAPDGGWPEGPGYWGYATKYTCDMLSALNSSLGADFGLSNTPGFSDTGTFRIASIGPSGQCFNYSDADAEAGTAPEMLWLSKRFNKPIYAVSEHLQVSKKRPDIFHLIWSLPNESELKADSQSLDAKFSKIDLACFRTSWTDPDAFFVGFKGGSNTASHGHLDLGTFVMDALGERWAMDLGPDDYDLPGYFGAQRWDYYRLRSEGHNTLTFGTENQVLTAMAALEDFHSTPERGTATVNLTEAYSSRFKQVKRQITLERTPNRQVVVTDMIEGGKGKAIRWNMHTRANIKISGNTALLESNGRHLRATIVSPTTANFEVIGATPLPPQAQQPDIHNLIINYRASSASSQISVAFSPG